MGWVVDILCRQEVRASRRDSAEEDMLSLLVNKVCRARGELGQVNSVNEVEGLTYYNCVRTRSRRTVNSPRCITLSHFEESRPLPIRSSKPGAVTSHVS